MKCDCHDLNLMVSILLLFLAIRKETKDDQLMAAQTHLKLGEVSAESGISQVDQLVSFA